jgi:hypothetical protein
MLLVLSIFLNGSITCNASSRGQSMIECKKKPKRKKPPAKRAHSLQGYIPSRATLNRKQCAKNVRCLALNAKLKGALTYSLLFTLFM